MTTITASAPGKAVLFGEYVVLDGATAGSIAVGRRAEVTLCPHDVDCSIVASPGYLDGEFRFRSENGTVRWIDRPPTPDAFAILEAAWRRVPTAEPVSVTLDTRAFRDAASGHKLGLGSSAALATALVAALDPETDAASARFALARDVHSDFQAGSGSGIDVATSCYGGAIAYRRGSDAAALRWPDGLSYRLYWSGVSADTVTQLASYRRRAPSSTNSALIAATEAVLQAFRQGAANAVLGALAGYVDALSEFDRAHALGIFGAGHDRLTDAARELPGCVYKPCGAGGGDVGIALAASEGVLDGFGKAVQEYGFWPLDAALDSDGARVRID